MKAKVCASMAGGFGRWTSGRGCSHLLAGMLAGAFLIHPQTTEAGLSFVIGTPTAVGSVEFSSAPDTVIITGALTGPGAITGGLAIPANRIQYDVINSDQGPMESWTVYYAPTVGPQMIGAFTPLGYVTSTGAVVPEGGFAYTTLFNAGYGLYTYNTGAPWTIDYEPDHITFSSAAVPPIGLPPNDGIGELNPTAYLPSFAILYDPTLGNGLVPATAVVGSANESGQVYGPLPAGNPCISVYATNMVVQTCSSCVPVNFSASAVDNCCANVTVQYEPPSGTCLPANSTNIVVVVATDSCGNAATNHFTVTVVPGPNCLPTNCISIDASNITVYSCEPCTPVPFNNVTAVDRCCPGSGVTLTFNPPPSQCFPQGSTTVLVKANDQCGNTATATFTVTVLPGPNCGNTNCIAIYATNIVVETCSNCTTVPFNVQAFDTCCSNLTLKYYPDTNTCFPLNTTTPVEIVGTDSCGNAATNYITVTVQPSPNCDTNPCLVIYATNVTVYTCSNCTTVPLNGWAFDSCCSSAPNPIPVTFSTPVTFCFPQGNTPVLVTAADPCGNMATKMITVTVMPAAGCATNPCITIDATNITVYTCSNCTTVPFNATAFDACCPSGGEVTLVYNPPTNTCFPLNSTTPIQITAYDQCGNAATNYITVTVLQAAGCGTNPCLVVYATNIVVYTCSNCTTVPFNITASDTCCPLSGSVTIETFPPTNTCFPLNTTTPVMVIGNDQCGNAATNVILVTVLPGPNCGGTHPGIAVTGKTGGGATNYITLSWNATNGQLQGSSDMIHWAPIPGATNSPYVAPMSSPMNFYRLHYY